jgi:hypothetical protein
MLQMRDRLRIMARGLQLAEAAGTPGSFELKSKEGSTIMKTFLKLGIAFCLAGTASYAANWNGKLLDASCYDKNASTADHKASPDIGKVCAPTSATTAFAFQSSVSGRVYKLDEQSNAKAEKAMGAGVLKAGKKDGEYRVFVSGSHKTGVMAVNGISPQRFRDSSVY